MKYRKHLHFNKSIIQHIDCGQRISNSGVREWVSIVKVRDKKGKPPRVVEVHIDERDLIDKPNPAAARREAVWRLALGKNWP